MKVSQISPQGKCNTSTRTERSYWQRSECFLGDHLKAGVTQAHERKKAISKEALKSTERRLKNTTQTDKNAVENT